MEIEQHVTATPLLIMFSLFHTVYSPSVYKTDESREVEFQNLIQSEGNDFYSAWG